MYPTNPYSLYHTPYRYASTTYIVRFVCAICDEWLFVLVSSCVVYTVHIVPHNFFSKSLSTTTSTLHYDCWKVFSAFAFLLYWFSSTPIFCENDETLFFVPPAVNSCRNWTWTWMAQTRRRRRKRIENSYESSSGSVVACTFFSPKCFAIQFTFFFSQRTQLVEGFHTAGMFSNRKRFKTK